MSAPLGNDSFAHVPCRIEIEMGQVPDQHFRPVRLGKPDIFTRRIFQVPMRAEMDKGICLESFLHI